MIKALLAAILILLLINCNDETPDKKAYSFLRNLSTDINKVCPIQVDSILKLENTVALPPRTFRYNYTLRYDTNKYDLHEFEKSLRKTTANSVKTNPDAKTLKALFATIEFNYNDTLGNFLFRITVNPEDYIR